MKVFKGIGLALIALIIILLLSLGVLSIAKTVSVNNQQEQKVLKQKQSHGYNLVYEDTVGQTYDNDNMRYQVAYRDDKNNIVKKDFKVDELSEVVGTEYTTAQFFEDDGNGHAVIRRAPYQTFDENNDSNKPQQNFSVSDGKLSDGTYKVYWYDTEILADSNNTSQQVVMIQGEKNMDRLMDNDHKISTAIDENITSPYLTISKGNYVLHRAPYTNYEQQNVSGTVEDIK